MHLTWLLTIFGFMLLNQCFSANVRFSEFGSHLYGDEESFIYHGKVPSFVPVYRVNVTHNRTLLEKDYTYLRVEYTNEVSKVDVEFNSTTFVVTFRIILPFVSMPITIIGYSMPLEQKQGEVHVLRMLINKYFSYVGHLFTFLG